MAAGLLALPFGTAHAAETPVYDTSQAALAQSQLREWLHKNNTTE